MLFLAIAPMPYGYYSLLRTIVTGVSIFGALICHEKAINLTYVFVGIAIAFNPFLKIELTREIWIPIDIATAIFFLYAKHSITSSKN